jgi:AraC family transcriptional regulator
VPQSAGSKSVDVGAVRVGEFRCPPADPLWAGLNWIGPEAHIVFPSVPVRIRQTRGEEFVTTRNHVVLYAGGDEYVRRRVGDLGDRSYFLALRPELAAELGGTAKTRGLADLPADLFLRQRRLIAAVRSAAEDVLHLEELAIDLAAAVLRPGRLAPPATPPHLRALAERAKELLGVEYAESHRLADLAAILGISPYHLARSFRAVTGWSLHEYRTSLRLRAVVDVLVDPSADLASVARDAGFANHSHLTACFRREFGLTPSAARNALAA